MCEHWRFNSASNLPMISAKQQSAFPGPWERVLCSFLRFLWDDSTWPSCKNIPISLSSLTIHMLRHGSFCSLVVNFVSPPGQKLTLGRDYICRCCSLLWCARHVGVWDVVDTSPLVCPSAPHSAGSWYWWLPARALLVSARREDGNVSSGEERTVETYIYIYASAYQNNRLHGRDFIITSGPSGNGQYNHRNPSKNIHTAIILSCWRKKQSYIKYVNYIKSIL